jgi:hypothetical protein
MGDTLVASGDKPVVKLAGMEAGVQGLGYRGA